MLRFLARTLLGGTVMYLSGLFLWERYYAVERFLPPQFVDNQLASESTPTSSSSLRRP